jgi:hypothetical protein
MSTKNYRILGKVIDQKTRAVITGLRVEAWDKDLIFNALLGNAITDNQGAFEIAFSESHFLELFGEQRPDIFFKIFHQNELIMTTEHSVLWNVEAAEIPVVIEGDFPMEPPKLSRFPLTQHTRGIEVKELQVGLGKLGYLLPSSEREEQLFGTGTRDALLELQTRYRLPNTGSLDEVTKIALASATAQAESNHYLVDGRIFLENGLPANGITLRLYTRLLEGKKSLLAETKTGSHGFYRLPYDPGGKAANLEVVAVDAENREVIPPLSSTKFNAGKHEILNLVAPTSIQPLEPEYKRLAGDLEKQLGDLGKLANAREHAQQPDLTLLHQATGWDARLIALAALAQKRSVETGIPHDALYALFRTGLPNDKNLLALVASETVEKALQNASKTEIVKLAEKEIAAAKVAFEGFARNTRLTLRAPGTLSTLGELLLDSGLDSDQQAAFADIVFAHGNSPKNLWKTARANGISEEQIQKLRLQGKLAYLTFNHGPLMATLQRELGSPDHIDRLVELDLYREDTWKNRLNDLAVSTQQTIEQLIPPAYAADTVDARFKAYTADLARKVRLSFPTLVVARRIQIGEFPLGPSGQRDRSLENNAHTFLKNANALGFELGRVPLGKFIKENRSVVFQGIPAEHHEATTQSIKRLQRLYQITPSDEALGTLLSNGFASAQDVISIPYEDFLGSDSTRFLKPEEADLTYRKALQVSAVTLNFYTSARQLVSSPTVYAMSPSPDRREEAQEDSREQVQERLIKHFPTLEYLFNSLDYCECEHCRSVLSPAAYFVDLLKFLERGNPWQTPYDWLIKRRPDLPYLPLTCENTNTVLPYIDVVNEILEYSVAYGKLTEEAAYDTGDAKSAELLAEPQNIEPRAYAKLEKRSPEACYPLTLPFDLSIETAREFASYFDTSLWQLLEAFRKTDELFDSSQPFDRAAIFTEYLGISPGEYAVFTHRDEMAAWHRLYGYPYESSVDAKILAKDEDGQRIDLNSAKTLSRRLDVSYKELVELVQTSFVNPGLKAAESEVMKLGFNLQLQDVVHYFNYRGRPDFAAEQRVFEELLDQKTRAALEDSWSRGAFNQTLLLRDLSPSQCSFNETILEFADRRPAEDLVFLKLNLFVRLWKKLGWTIEETDRALEVFLPSSLSPLTMDNLAEALKTALVYIAHLKALDERINLENHSRLDLIDLWSSTDQGDGTTPYAKRFQKVDYRTGLDMYFFDRSALLKDHLLPLQGAIGLTSRDMNPIIARAGADPNPLFRSQNIHINNQPDSGIISASLREEFSQNGVFLSESARIEAVAEASKRLVVDADKTYIIEMAGDTAVIYDYARSGISTEIVSTVFRYGLLAKALDLSVTELLTLQQLSGLDPFPLLSSEPLETREDDKPFTHTLEFLDVMEKVKQSGFQVEDIEYLLLHRFDPVGKYRPDPQQLLALTKLLSTEILRIQDEHAVPGDTTGLTDELLRQELMLLLPGDLVNSFLGILAGTWEYRMDVKREPSQKLEPQAFVADPALRITYDEVRKIQSISYRGILLDQRKERFKTLSSSSEAGNLFDQLQSESFAFIADNVVTVIGTLTGMTEYEATKAVSIAADTIKPPILTGDSAIRFHLDRVRRTLRLAHRGVLSEARRQALTERDEVPEGLRPVLLNLLTNVQEQSRFATTQLIESTISILAGLAEYEAAGIGILPENAMVPTLFDGEPALTVNYDAESKTQRLRYRGILSDKKKIEYQNLQESPLLTQLLDNVQNQAQSLLRRLLDEIIRCEPEDFKDFKNLIEADKLVGSIEASRSQLALVIFPLVQQKLIRQFTVQTLANELKITPSLTDALLTDRKLLSDPSYPDQPLLDAFSASAERGVNVAYFSSSDGTGEALETRTVATVFCTEKALMDFGKPEQANSARFDGYFEVPAAGAYRFFVWLGHTDAVAELRLDDLPDPILLGKADANRELSSFVELKSGISHRFTLILRNLDGHYKHSVPLSVLKKHRGSLLNRPDFNRLQGNDVAALWVQGESLPKGSLDRLTLYPEAAVERVRRARVLLEKVVQLVQGVTLSEREVHYLFSNAADSGNLDLNLLPTSEMDDSDDSMTRANALFEQFIRLTDYNVLRREVAGGTDGLIDVFENAHRTVPVSIDSGEKLEKVKKELLVDLCRRFGELIRRDSSTVQDMAVYLGFTVNVNLVGKEAQYLEAPGFASEIGLTRLWKALQIVERFGVRVTDLASLTGVVNVRKTSEERFSIIKRFRSAVKRLYADEPENWKRIAQSIFDKLRRKQRDALVAYVVANHSERFKNANELFEYFLLDPGMEPVVQTSRLRLAISSVQTFIQRCLLNLEPKVSPTAIDSEQWKWMKRYRVWEANRKIFLFPENWLEPEFRNDKSFLFQELESELLQGDVSNDLAEEALIKYLNGLDEIARLEMVTMCTEHAWDPKKPGTLHVIGRTYNTPHKYFYRRYADTAWSPWEPVTAEIEGDQVVAAMWQGHLHLFWVTLLPASQGSKEAQSTLGILPGNRWEDLKGTTVPTFQDFTAEVHVQFSEYSLGTWKATERVSFNNVPVRTTNKDHGKSPIGVQTSDGVITICISDTADKTKEQRIKIFSKHELARPWSAPLDLDEANKFPPYLQTPNLIQSNQYPYFAIATQWVGKEPLAVTDFLAVHGQSCIEYAQILTKGDNFRLLPLPLYSSDCTYRDSPFFYLDSREGLSHTFFVEPKWDDLSVQKRETWVLKPPEITTDADIDWRPPIYTEEQTLPDPRHLDPIDRLAQYKVQPSHDAATNPLLVIQYDGSFVSATGGFNTLESAVNATGFSRTGAASIVMSGSGLSKVMMQRDVQST